MLIEKYGIMIHSPHITIMDDEKFYHTLITALINRYQEEKNVCYVAGLETSSYLHVSDFRQNFHQQVDILILDYFLDKGITCQRVLKEFRKEHPMTHIIIISKYIDIRSTLGSILSGANEFIQKDEHFIKNLELHLDQALAKYMKPNKN